MVLQIGYDTIQSRMDLHKSPWQVWDRSAVVQGVAMLGMVGATAAAAVALRHAPVRAQNLNEAMNTGAPSEGQPVPSCSVGWGGGACVFLSMAWAENKEYTYH